MRIIKQLQELFDKELGNVYDSQVQLSKATIELMIALGWLTYVTPFTAELSIELTKKGLEFYKSKIQKQLDIAGWVEIIFTLSYLESFDTLVQKNYCLREETQLKIIQWQKQIENTVNELEQLEFNDELIQETLTNLPTSRLGRALNNLLSTYLEQSQLDTHTISIITGWITWETQKHVESLLSCEKDEFVARVKSYISVTQNIKANQKYHSIESYLTKHISSSLSNPLQVFDKVTISDIYIPLKCHLLNSDGTKREYGQLVDLETWAFEQLINPNKNNQVMFIQGESGQGKTVFCKIFAHFVREHLHPIWTPILIRLQDIDTFEVDIENTLRAVIKEDFAHNNDWLTDDNTRFLFILDGFDQLRLEGRNSGAIEKFLKQVGNYQIKCQTNSNLGHRFLVTGRFAALHSIEQFMPCNLERVEIALMHNQLQEQWLNKWGNLVGTYKAQAFQSFLQSECPEHVFKLSQEPLLLHLLAAMHRDKKLTAKTFEGLDSIRAKILIYQSALDSVLIQSQEKFNLNTSELQYILTEVGLCVIQSGKGWAPIKIIEERLRSNTITRKLLRNKWHIKENILNNAFTIFYPPPASNYDIMEGYIEFVHKSFSEYLCAKRLADSLSKCTQIDLHDSEKQFFVTDNQLAKEIYDLLYYGGLAPEIVEYVIALLDYDYNQVKLVNTLFKRLEHFYIYWCKGKFINTYPQNFSQNKILRTKALVFSGLKEIDIYTGLNVMILLLELSRYAQTHNALKNEIVFYPCGDKDSENFEDDLLFCIISYSNNINLYTFLDTVGYFLSNIQLSGARLSSVNLSSVKLNHANLSAVDFSNAKLRFADLSGADLSNADLSGANLSHANLSNANLHGANLSNANLSNANLNHAKLTYTDITSTNFVNAQNLTTQQVRVANNWDKAEYNPEFSRLLFSRNELID